MFTGQPRHVRSFLWFLAGSALVLLIFVFLSAGREPEWVPSADFVDDELIPVNDPSPPHFTPGTLAPRADSAIAPVPMAAPYSTRWRAGVGVPDLDLAYFDWPVDRPGWYLNWSTNLRIEPIFLGLGRRSVMEVPPDRFGMEFTPMVRMKNGRLFPDTHTLRDLARRYRGLTWLIGNEPDVRWQDNTPPEIYAVAYHRAYSAIKEGDPTAQVAIGGVSQITPLRLDYLTRAWDFYRSLYGTAHPRRRVDDACLRVARGARRLGRQHAAGLLHRATRRVVGGGRPRQPGARRTADMGHAPVDGIAHGLAGKAAVDHRVRHSHAGGVRLPARARQPISRR